ncbi:MAG: glycosyltransferase, partial [Clostridia bacterium]|nr:glycosyltransferase [Clostridia bacterium]
MQNKNPINVMKAIMSLRRIIKEEKIELVHSHARIPSFILGKMQKFMRFPFVTTAHWVFNTKYGLKYITDWGQKTVAVSEDIKTYLMDNYKVPEGNIRVTINGIDTDKFSPDTDDADIRAELGIKPEDTVIVYVSRMDESRSLAARHLIEAVPETDKLVKNLKVIVVGGGDDFENVKAKAAAVNKELGRDCIVMTGARTDINRLIAPAELFVGVSRAALEAMAAEKPVIIAGNEGYIGLFGEDKLQVGIDTNFCCRGCEQSSPELIFADIRRFFEMDGHQRKELAQYGRELIKRDYSVARMADDTVRVYEWALGKNDEILISGYYGFKNSGDDALLKALIADLRKYLESPELVVLSANPRETWKNYRVKAINRFNIPLIIKHMKRADMLISGGGTLIQDATSTQSLLYYLTIIKLAIKNKLKVMLYSNGIGPL